MKSLTPLDEAVDRVIATARAVRDDSPPDIRTISIWEASGFVLAEGIVADRDQPPFDKSMMDGFALRTADLGAGEARLRVVAEIAAGDLAPRALGPGEAMAIMTGAPVPEGADAIQVVELCRRDGEHVVVQRPAAVGDNIQRAGSQARKGDVVVERGRVVEALTAGVLGTMGAAQFRVYRRPRVTVVATGDELMNIEETPGPAQIRDSNRRTLMALLDAEWCRVVDGGIVPDDRAALRRAIHEGKESDVLVLSGGVSAGAYDLVRECLELEGCEVLFHQIAIKPGKPVLFGRMGETLVFGLPGNPVSAFVTAVLLLAPAVRVLGRRPEHRTWYLPLPLAGALHATGRRTTFHPGDLVRDADDRLSVMPRPWDGSADHIRYSRSNVLIRCEADAGPAAPGDHVRVVLPHALATW
ncbi:MAG: molybdopterin molybdotransferase MoeA [Deltaproteobacteria bacterium]|nr:molybdopterin molybdotransferase MoeA [Deltaproteobacteria bacterium]